MDLRQISKGLGTRIGHGSIRNGTPISPSGLPPRHHELRPTWASAVVSVSSVNHSHTQATFVERAV